MGGVWDGWEGTDGNLMIDGDFGLNLMFLGFLFNFLEALARFWSILSD